MENFQVNVMLKHWYVKDYFFILFIENIYEILIESAADSHFDIRKKLFVEGILVYDRENGGTSFLSNIPHGDILFVELDLCKKCDMTALIYNHVLEEIFAKTGITFRIRINNACLCCLDHVYHEKCSKNATKETRLSH